MELLITTYLTLIGLILLGLVTMAPSAVSSGHGKAAIALTLFLAALFGGLLFYAQSLFADPAFLLISLF